MKYVYRVIAISAVLGFSGISVLSFDSEELSNEGRLIVAFDDSDVIPDLEALAEDHGSEIEISHSLGLIYWKGWNSEVKSAIEDMPGIVSVEPEQRVTIAFEPDDEYYSSVYQWGVMNIQAEDAWDYTIGSEDVIIAILDTGIDYSHDDLSANMWQDPSGYYGYDFWNDDTNPMDDNRHGYDNGAWEANMNIYHGTHVAGIAGAVIDNEIGIAGVSQSKLMAVKVMNDSGEGTDATVAEGIEYAVDNGAHVICMSLGVESSTMALRRAVDYAKDNGVLLVAAAGNDGSSSVAYPAAFPQVIAVGATDKSDHKASFSNYGTNLEIMAPGTNIWSTKRGDQYQYLSGTSTAAPFVAGVAGLMLSVNPALTPAEIRTALNNTADDLGTPGFDHMLGWGLVDAHEAVTSVSGPAATIIDYPSRVNPNETLTINWVVSGGSGLTIDNTYLLWGYSADQLDHTTGTAAGYTTPHTFEAADVISPPDENSILYLQAVAVIEGVEYRSRLVEIDVSTIVPDPLTELMSNVKKLIVDDIGVINFMMIIFAIIALATIAATVRGRRRAARAAQRRAAAIRYARAPAPSAPQPGYGAGYTPPPPFMPSVYVDIVDDQLLPQVIEVDEGTRIVWRNRGWAPPPGISIVSGTADSTGTHPDGLFASGQMIAPGEYWSCIFNRRGFYPYYITNLNIRGKILVRGRAVKSEH